MPIKKIGKDKLEAFTGLHIERKCKMFAMPKEMQKGLPRLAEEAKAQGLETSGIPYTLYHGLDAAKLTNQGAFSRFLGMFTEVWHFDMGFPVVGEPEDNGEIKVVSIETQEVVSGLHIGPYHKVGASYKELYQWIFEQKLEPLDYCFEFYLNDPHITAANQLETKIIVPIKV